MSQPTEQSEPPLTPTRYFVLVWLCSAAVIAYVHRNSLGVAESSVREDLGLTREEMGVVLSSFFWGYAVFQIPSGWLADRWGTRRLLSLIALVWSLATAAIAWADDFETMVVLRFIGGVAQAGIFACATKSILHWFPSTERGMSSGFLGGFMSVGGAIGAFATGYLLPLLSWQSIFLLYAVPGLVWGAWFYVWFRDRPEVYPSFRQHSSIAPLTLPSPPAAWGDRMAHSDTSITPSPPAARGEGRGAGAVAAGTAEPTPWEAIVTSPTMWWIGGQQFFRAAGYIFYASWFTTFLKESRDVSIGQAGVLTSLPLWAVVIGSPLGGIVSDWALARTGSRRVARSGVAAVTMFGCAILIGAAYFVGSVWLAVLLISVGSFCSSIGGPCAYAVTIDVGGNHVGTVFSVMNMCGNIGAAVFPLVVPTLVDMPAGWDLVLFVFAGIYIAAGVCWMLVNPNGSICDRKH
jgi:MFS family permease